MNSIYLVFSLFTVPGCPNVAVTSETVRPWSDTDKAVVQALHEHCKLHNRWYGKTLLRRKNYHYDYTCGPRTDCKE